MRLGLAALALAISPALALATELSVGTVELSGFSNLGLSTSATKVDGATTAEGTAIQALVSGFFYVTPHVGIGATVGFSDEDARFYLQTLQPPAGTLTGSRVTVHTTSLLVGPAVSVDVPLAAKTSVFLQGEIGYSRMTRSESGMADLRSSGYGGTAGAGLRYFVVNAVALDAGVRWSYASVSGDVMGGRTQRTTSRDLAVNAGVSVFFGR